MLVALACPVYGPQIRTDSPQQTQKMPNHTNIWAHKLLQLSKNPDHKKESAEKIMTGCISPCKMTFGHDKFGLVYLQSGICANLQPVDYTGKCHQHDNMTCP